MTLSSGTTGRDAALRGLAVLPLLQSLRELAADPDLHHLLDPGLESQRLQLRSTPDLEAWLVSWPPGAVTGWHDHGPSASAYTTLTGRLTEHSWDLGLPRVTQLGRGESRAHAAGQAHEVRNDSEAHVLSVHVYAPRLTTVTHYRHAGGRLELVGLEDAAHPATGGTR